MISAAASNNENKKSEVAGVVDEDTSAKTQEEAAAAAIAAAPSFQERKRQLLLEARQARIDWIRAAGPLPFEVPAGTGEGGDGYWGDGDGNPLSDLRACGTEALPSAPVVIEALYRGVGCEDARDRIRTKLEEVFSRERLAPNTVCLRLDDPLTTALMEEKRDPYCNEDAAATHSDGDDDVSDSPRIPSASSYKIFIDALCRPECVDVVLITRKFVATVEEAARVMVQVSNVEQEQQEAQHLASSPAPAGGSAALAKAVRGFINSTARKLESHPAFVDLRVKQQAEASSSAEIAAANHDGRGVNEDVEGNTQPGYSTVKERVVGDIPKKSEQLLGAMPQDDLLACLEAFVFAKCRRSIRSVLALEDEDDDKNHDHHEGDGGSGGFEHQHQKRRRKTIREADEGLHEKLMCLQFVTPAHLEIDYLKADCEEETKEVGGETYRSGGENEDIRADRGLGSGGNGEGSAASSEREMTRIDLSGPIKHLRGIERQRSPRQMLRCILLAHREIHTSLTEAIEARTHLRHRLRCTVAVASGESTSDPVVNTGAYSKAVERDAQRAPVSATSTVSTLPSSPRTPPGADDVLPTLILAVIRSRATNLVSDLRFVDAFAPRESMRGETGYACANLCGAVQFLKRLDLEGHAKEVTLAGGLAEDATLLIPPEEFREGLARCRTRMREEEEKEERRRQRMSGTHGDESKVLIARSLTDDGVYECPSMTKKKVYDEEEKNACSINISAREVREARTRGEVINLGWATRKREAQLWEHGGRNCGPPSSQRHSAEPGATATKTVKRKDGRSSGPELRLPPEEPPLPDGFTRSYAFVATDPDEVRVVDLPRLLREYRMLVRATENLLSERTAWRETERKRHTQWMREKLESNYEAEINTPLDGNMMNGFRKI